MAASGYPLWSRASGIGSMGASETLRDYLDLGPPNVLDSVTAEQYAALAQAIAMMASTAATWILDCTAQDATTAAPTVSGLSAVALPTAARVADGEYTLTHAGSYTDESGATGSVATRWAACSVVAGTGDAQGTCEIDSSTQTTINVDDVSATTAVADSRFFVEVL